MNLNYYSCNLQCELGASNHPVNLSPANNFVFDKFDPIDACKTDYLENIKEEIFLID